MGAAATVGTKLTIPFIVGAGQIVGQGNYPEHWVLYSTDDASDTDPKWTDASAKVRGFSTSRGRGSELEDIDAGTATLTLDNRTRTFDPVINTAIRPMNRWWIREQFSGETQSIILGYAESYDQRWSKGGETDAVTTVTIADEFKVLALDHLPVTDPPRDSYADVIMFDEPAGYWKMDDDPATLLAAATVGPALTIPDVPTSIATAIAGDRGSALQLAATKLMQTSETVDTGAAVLDLGFGVEFAIEFWFRSNTAAPGLGGDTIAYGPLVPSVANRQWVMSLNAGGQIVGQAWNATPTAHTVTDPTVITANTWYHLVLTITGGNLRLYVNGAQVASTAWTGNFDVANTNSTMEFGDLFGAGVYGYDEAAFYRVGLSAARIAAHYQAGTARGFVEQRSGVRVAAILDAAESSAPRAFHDISGAEVPANIGVRDIQPAFMKGQSPLSECRQAVYGENDNAMLFISSNGAVTFLAADHRSHTAYSTVQATFDDDGTDLPYHDLDLDFTESFLFNEINATREGGLLQTASDTASIARYMKRPQSLTGLPVRQDNDALAIATALLAKYKDPLTRILSLDLTTADPGVTAEVFRLDLGKRIRVFRTPPGGGARIDQSLWIQKVQVEAGPNPPWRVTLGVSPL